MYHQLIYNGMVVKRDTGLDILLSLDGTECTEENGYWYKIEVSQVPKTKERPHGIRYNLTFHDNYNQRILGFDNAHQLLNDFLNEVNSILNKLNGGGSKA